MAINKNFVVKHGLEVNDGLIFADVDNYNVGVGTTVANYNLHVIGGIGATDLIVTGFVTTRSLNVSGDIYLGNSFIQGIGVTNLNVSGIATINNAIVSGVATISTNLNVGAGNTSLVTLNNNVGIATTNPTQRFQVGFTSTTSGIFVVTHDGRVGVQTNEPGPELHVFGNETVTGVITATTFIGQVNSGLATISTLDVDVATIDYLTGTNLNYSGISTLGNVLIGGGTTDLVVTGDARVTGILTIGTSSVTIDGPNNIISGVESYSGTNINLSGILTATTIDGSLSGTATTTTNIPDLTGDIVSANTVTSISPGVIVNADINSSANIALSKLSSTGSFRSTTINSTNISGDSGYFNVGIITTLSGTGLNYSGVGTISTLDTTNGTIDYLDATNINASGIVTATSFSGSGANLTSLTGASAATYGDSGSTPVITVDSNGRITGISTAAVSGGGAVPNNGTLTLNTSGTGLSGSATFTADQAGNSTFTVTSNATSSNTNSTIVARDASGNFSAGTITASLSGNATSATSATSATTAGSCTGNAATATTLQTARTINGVSFNGSANIVVEPYIEDDEGTATTRYIVFTDNSSAGYKRLNEDSSLNYNPSTNTLTAGTFSGSLSGNATSATSATNATNFDVAADNATNATHYLIFTGGATGNQRPNSDTALYYNPSSNTLTAGTFSGSLSGNATSATNATNATNFDVAADNSTNANHYLIFTGGATGNQRPNSDTALYYNPSTDTLTAGNFNSTSDINLKKDIEVITNATELLNQINGVKFTWKDTNNKSVGVIAQEIEKVLPELVTENDGTKTVNYNGLIGVLIEAVKELSARVEELESNK